MQLMWSLCRLLVINVVLIVAVIGTGHLVFWLTG